MLEPQISCAKLVGRSWSTTVGQGHPLRVSVALGANNQETLSLERSKLATILRPDHLLPDVLVDLSLARTQPRLYTEMLESFGGPVGLLPHYVAFSNGRIDDAAFLREVDAGVRAGLSHLTLHVTANRQLLELSSTERLLPTTSRGGGMVLQDLESRSVSDNVFLRNWASLLEILRGSDTVVSLGATFRPARCSEAMDAAHRRELRLQAEIAEELLSHGIQVMREGVGHAYLNQLEAFAEELTREKVQIPLMALGPLAVDHAGSDDPIAAAVAIGALSRYPCFGIFQALTSQEHAGGTPTLESTIDALRIARLAADSVNASRGYHARSDLLGGHRQAQETCVTSSSRAAGALRRRLPPGCSRCGSACPLEVSLNRPDPVRRTLQAALPYELHQTVFQLVSALQSANLGSLLLFGSTAKRNFCFARRNGRLLLESDLEFNLIRPDAPNQEQQDEVVGILAKTMQTLPSDQPLFDVDVRFRTFASLADLPYHSILRRELFCYAVTDGRDADEAVSCETDMIDGPRLLPEYLKSTLEWLVLRLAHLARQEESELDWWTQAIRASLICKLAPHFTHLAGVPYTGTPLDVCALSAAPSPAPWVASFVNLLGSAWTARRDQTGEHLGSHPFTQESIISLLSSAIRYAGSVAQRTCADRTTLELVQRLKLLVVSEKSWRPDREWLESARTEICRIWARTRFQDPMFRLKYESHLGALDES